MSKNFNIESTIITDLIRISTASIWSSRDEEYQIETWIFSTDERYKSRCIIHGWTPYEDNSLIDQARRFHGKLAYKFNKTFNAESHS